MWTAIESFGKAFLRGHRMLPWGWMALLGSTMALDWRSDSTKRRAFSRFLDVAIVGRILDLSMVNFNNHCKGLFDVIKHNIARQFEFYPELLKITYVRHYLRESIRVTRYMWQKFGKVAVILNVQKGDLMC